ncbi:hypothetical protein DL95DRAFT_452361 [Leptodontidium sp. 2 PMI_412]|nr:hypothetical protein BKA61DRAFT_677638 [Leptodontidium sp. MPI-SDFR-AT-0119]KAH9224606.1 hypothetical protein DL95DRAFT_452361 [Leptodontidium sp. 2 PMI_412]
MAQAASSSGQTLRASAATFQPGLTSSSATSINNSHEVTAQNSHPESTVSNEKISLAGAPTEPAAMRQVGGQSGVRLRNYDEVARSGGVAQSNSNNRSKAQEQSKGRSTVAPHSRVAPSSSSYSNTPKGNSYVQSIAYHSPNGQFSTYKPGRHETDNNRAAMLSESKPVSHKSMLEVARRHVSCKGNSCQCQVIIDDLHDRLETSEMELITFKLIEPQLVEQFRYAAAAVKLVAILKRQLADMGRDKLLLEQRVRELEQTEEEKEAEVERNKKIEDFKKQFASQAPAAAQVENQENSKLSTSSETQETTTAQAEDQLASQAPAAAQGTTAETEDQFTSQTSAVAQAENQANSNSSTASKAQEPATAQAEDQQNGESSKSGNISEEAPVQVWRVRRQKADSTSTAASKQPTPPTTPEKVKYEFMEGGGISY